MSTTSIPSSSSEDSSVIVVSSQPPTPEKGVGNNNNDTNNDNDNDNNSTTTNNDSSEQQEAGGIVHHVSLCAVRLSQKMASSVVSAVATAGLVSTIVPESIVAATTLVAEVQAQAGWAVANRMLVHIPSDAQSIALMKKLVTDFARVNPASFQTFGSMTATQAAATTAVGGALPLLVAAALQESVELSKLMVGKSDVSQFSRATVTLAAQVAGGVAGMAAGAVAGSMVMPGIGTGIGGIAGSFAGATIVPAVTNAGVDRIVGPPASSNDPSSTNKDGGTEQQLQKLIDSQALLEDAKTSTIFSQASRSSIRFAWDDETTKEGFHLVNGVAVRGTFSNNNNDGDDSQQQQQGTEMKTVQHFGSAPKKNNDNDDDDDVVVVRNELRDHQEVCAEFVETARALLQRSTVVPMEDVQKHLSNNNNNQDGACGDCASSTSSESIALPNLNTAHRLASENGRGSGVVAVSETTAMLEQLPGTVLVLRASDSLASLAAATPSTAAAGASSTSLDQHHHHQTPAPQSLSRFFISDMEERVVEAEISGQLWKPFASK